jgi:hypothetical protein
MVTKVNNFLMYRNYLIVFESASNQLWLSNIHQAVEL